MTLFRQQAVSAQQAQTLGDIVLIRPVSFTYLTLFAVILAAVICGFVAWGAYTKRTTVVGQLSPYSGLLEIYVPQPGVVLEKHVTESQHVNAGDVLYVLSSERQSSRIGATQASISDQVDQRLVSLREEMQKTRELQTEEHNGLNQNIAALQRELSQLRSQIDVQRDHVQLSEDAVSRHLSLLQEHFISKDQLQQKQAELLDQKARQQSLERDYISISRELSAKKAELAGLSLKQQNQMAQLDRMISNASQELTESEAKRRLVITAPQSGTATAVIAEMGQFVDGDRPLAIVVPENAALHANIYAPSRSIGFIKPGDKVLIRYQAYPYQKFGHHEGVVETVSKTALPVNEISKLANVIRGGNNSEPMYLINVKLAEQSINAYGVPQNLQAGMLLDADILQEKRRLYEWVLEPLYSLSGKL